MQTALPSHRSRTTSTRMTTSSRAIDSIQRACSLIHLVQHSPHLFGPSVAKTTSVARVFVTGCGRAWYVDDAALDACGGPYGFCGCCGLSIGCGRSVVVFHHVLHLGCQVGTG